jgi:hypothetical protein
LSYRHDPSLTDNRHRKLIIKFQILDTFVLTADSCRNRKRLFWSPRWSPNGRYIAAQTADSTKLVLYDTETQKWHNPAELNAGYFSWSHDGKYIYLTTVATESVFARIRMPDGRRIETLVSLKDVRLFIGTFGA